MNKFIACLSGLTLSMVVTTADAAAAAKSDDKPPLVATPQSAAAVMACMRANIPKTLTVKDVQLDASAATGSTRTMKGKLYATRDDDKLRAMIRILAPGDLAGASYLLRERDNGDEMYVYIPALSKVRRVSGAAVDGSLWATDLSFSDIKQLSNAFSGSDPKMGKDEVLDGRAVHVLSVIPNASDSARFSRLLAWVDAKSCVALRVDFYEGQTVRKRLTVDAKSLRQDGVYWYASQLQMSDLGLGSNTRLKVLDIHPDDALPGRLFNPGTFYIGG